MSSQHDIAQFVTDAMLMAILATRPDPKRLLSPLRTRVRQYTSEQFQRLLSAHGVTCSMSRSWHCWDNAAMESFFSTLENRNAPTANNTPPGTKPERMCLTTSSVSTMLSADTRHWDI